MMWLLIGIGIFVIIAVVLFLILKKILKVVIILIGLIILALVVCGFFTYSDAKELQQNFETSNNLFLLEENEKIIAGVQTIPSTDEPYLLGEEEISSFDFYYQENDLQEIKGDNYKLIIFKKQAFDSVEIIELDEKEYTKEFIFTLIDSNTPIDDYIDDMVIREGIPQEQRELAKQDMKSGFEYTGTEFKGILFASVFAKSMDEQGPVFLFKQYKEENALIYKQTPVFRFVKLIPSSFLKNMIKKTTDTVKETVGSKLNKT